jgi:hypothetical protein
MGAFPSMTAYRPPLQLYNTTPIALADHPPPSTSSSRSHYHDPSPRSPPYVELERHPRSVIQPVQLSTEFLLKPQLVMCRLGLEALSRPKPALESRAKPKPC